MFLFVSLWSLPVKRTGQGTEYAGADSTGADSMSPELCGVTGPIASV